MIELFQRVGKDIRRGENLELYVTVLIALVLTSLNVLGFATPNLLASATLATLALLAIGLLVNRRQMEALVNVQHLGNTIIFTEDWPDLKLEFGQAREEICLVGINLMRTTLNNHVLFQQKLNQACRVHVLLMDPSGKSMDIVPVRMYDELGTSSGTSKSIHGTIKRWNKIAHDSKSPTSLELRVIDYVLPFGLVLIDPQLPSGKILVETYAYKMPEGDAPRFQLTSSQSPYWYSYFHRQFQALWNGAKRWEEPEDPTSSEVRPT